MGRAKRSGTESKIMGGYLCLVAWSLATVWGIFGACPASAQAVDVAEVSFRTDVQAVLAKAGCNLGTCHGNFNGKAGFRLSLRGEDPAFDHAALTRDMFARRVNPIEPDQSLILLKATGQLSHEGGRRFSRAAPEYEVLRRWIAGGAKDDGKEALEVVRLRVSPVEKILFAPDAEVQLEVRAQFSDGEERDVTSWAVYEPSTTFLEVSHDGLVTSQKPGEGVVVVRYLNRQVPVRVAFRSAAEDFVWESPEENNYVDTYVMRKLKALRMNPSGLSSDQTFVRRVYLDLTGRLPTAAQARAFLEDASVNKRMALIDSLLASEGYADFWALKWSDLLRNEEKALDRKGVQAYHRWIRESLRENKPLDQFVRELLTARGSTYDNPPANYYRSLRDPIARAESTAQLFLGTRLQCAKCHNHPFDRWTQEDYYDWADVFARVDYKVMDNNRRDKLDKHEFVGEQVVWMARSGSVKNPKTGQPAEARFLDMTSMRPVLEDAEPEAGGDGPGREPRRGEDALEAMADWLTSPDNPLFARSQVNRIWYHLMGRGLVDPIDDFRPTNPPSHPDLLDALAREFVASGFDVRQLIRTIAGSRTYQLSSEPHPGNRDDTMNYSHAMVRRLSAEQLLDAMSQALGVAPQFNGYPRGLYATQLPGVQAVRARERRSSSGDDFLKLFGKPERLLTCECERSDETTMGQAFQLISGDLIHELLVSEENRLGEMLAEGRAPAAMVESLYWAALQREPTPREKERCLELMSESPREGLEDIAWALCNSKEFLFRR